MKFRSWFILILTLFFTAFSAQIKDPVKFKYDIKPLANGEYEAILTATMESGWHIYSKDLPPDSGIPTEMKISGENIVPVGGTVEIGKKHDEYSEAFGAQIVYYSNSAQFKRKFKLKDPAKPGTAAVEITYQTCDDRVCLAPNTLEFEKAVSPTGKIEESKTAETAAETPQKDSATALTTSAADTASIASAAASIQKLDPKYLKINSLDFNNPLTDCGTVKEKHSENYWTYLLLGFLGGLIALLTPVSYTHLRAHET